MSDIYYKAVRLANKYAMQLVYFERIIRREGCLSIEENLAYGNAFHNFNLARSIAQRAKRRPS